MNQTINPSDKKNIANQEGSSRARVNGLPPTNHIEFENIATEILPFILKINNTSHNPVFEKYGVNGQKQGGIDHYCQEFGIATQSKYQTSFTPKQLRDAVSLCANEFANSHPVNEFWIILFSKQGTPTFKTNHFA